MTTYLLDTNTLIAVFDDDATTSTESKQQAREHLQDILNQENSMLVITPLILYETLRNIPQTDNARFSSVQNALKQFPIIDIQKEAGEIATNMYRAIKASSSPEVNMDKRNFDIVHFAVSKHHDLKMVSMDSDMSRMETIYKEIQATNE